MYAVDPPSNFLEYKYILCSCLFIEIILNIFQSKVSKNVKYCGYIGLVLGLGFWFWFSVLTNVSIM